MKKRRPRKKVIHETRIDVNYIDRSNIMMSLRNYDRGKSNISVSVFHEKTFSWTLLYKTEKDIVSVVWQYWAKKFKERVYHEENTYE